MLRTRSVLTRAGAACLTFAVLSIGAIAPSPAADKAPVNVGIIYSKTGLLGIYGTEYLEGFQIGLDYATHGTGAAAGHKIVVSDRDDAGVGREKQHQMSPLWSYLPTLDRKTKPKARLMKYMASTRPTIVKSHGIILPWASG